MKIAVIDAETDPFLHGRRPEPFVWGFYSVEHGFRFFWGDNCTAQLIAFIRTLEGYVIYAHNGGRFDFFFFIEEFRGNVKIVNRRLLSGTIGDCEMRDSWGIIPEPLRAYKKDDIDYSKMERAVRQENRDEIISYLRTDCVSLFELCQGFFDEFGNRLTIGGTAMRELKEFHKFETMSQWRDTELRDFYFGGRNQVFAAGLHYGRFKIYDINSAYAFVMATRNHPISQTWNTNNRITDKTNFALIEADSDDCLPWRPGSSEEGYGLKFGKRSGQFFATIHEIEEGEATGRLHIQRVIRAYEFHRTGNFAEFINHFQSSQVAAEQRGDILLRMFYKRVKNSAYGKFAQNPENYREYCFTGPHDPAPKGTGWEPGQQCGDYLIWEKESERKSYFNIATAASITGATRSHLFRGIVDSEQVIYCDTDSIICSQSTVAVDKLQLGAWKLEKECDIVAIAGKKLYCCFEYVSGPDTDNNRIVPGQDRNRDGIFLHNGRWLRPVKFASKGARLKPADILRIAEDRNVEIKYEVDAPVFDFFKGGTTFVKRTIKRTAPAKRREAVRYCVLRERDWRQGEFGFMRIEPMQRQLI